MGFLSSKIPSKLKLCSQLRILFASVGIFGVIWIYLALPCLIRFGFGFNLLYEIVWKLNRGVPLNLISNANTCVGFNLN